MLKINVRATVGALELQAKIPKIDGTTVVVGPNGAGKSTLLKCILGVLRPQGGAISLSDRALFSRDGRVNVPVEDRRLGYVPQKYALFPHMTVFENVAFGLDNLDREAQAARVHELLEDLGISHLVERKAKALSGGESQRVALARALAVRPKALLLDEPMAALDAGSRRKVREFLSVRLRAIGIPTIVVSHDLEDVEALGGTVVVLEEGQVTQIGTLSELRDNPQTPYLREFLAEEPSVPPSHLAEIKAWE